jgi:hypothetical protein
VLWSFLLRSSAVLSLPSSSSRIADELRSGVPTSLPFLPFLSRFYSFVASWVQILGQLAHATPVLRFSRSRLRLLISLLFLFFLCRSSVPFLLQEHFRLMLKRGVLVSFSVVLLLVVPHQLLSVVFVSLPLWLWSIFRGWLIGVALSALTFVFYFRRKEASEGLSFVVRRFRGEKVALQAEAEAESLEEYSLWCEELDAIFGEGYTARLESLGLSRAQVDRLGESADPPADIEYFLQDNIRSAETTLGKNLARLHLESFHKESGAEEPTPNDSESEQE